MPTNSFGFALSVTSPSIHTSTRTVVPPGPSEARTISDRLPAHQMLPVASRTWFGPEFSTRIRFSPAKVVANPRTCSGVHPGTTNCAMVFPTPAPSIRWRKTLRVLAKAYRPPRLAGGGDLTELTQYQGLPIGERAPDFSLPGVDGATYTLASFKDKPVLVVAFWCNHCLYVQAWEHRTIATQKAY